MNQCFYIGNLGRDPEERTSQNGEIYATFSLAVSNGQNRPTQWISVSCYRDIAQRALKYLKKGDKVCVRGRSSAGAWIGRDGEARGELRVNADMIEYCSWRREENAAAPETGAEPVPVEDDDDKPF